MTKPNTTETKTEIKPANPANFKKAISTGQAMTKKGGVTKAEVARAMGVSYETFNGWESGRRQMPAVAIRCVELLLLYPKTARKLGKTEGSHRD